MTTARDIVKKALQKNGVLTKGEDVSGDEAVDALFSLNALLSSWSNESLFVYTREFEEFPLVNGQASYTMGAGGVFDTERPIKIDSAFVRQGNIDHPLSIINAVDFDLDISLKTTTSIPYAMSNDNGYPLNTIRLFPVPSEGWTIHIRSQKPLTELTTLDSTLSLPSGWERALIFNLAVEISSEYGQPLDQATYQISGEAKAAIKKATARNRSMDAYPSIRGGNEINSGLDS